MWETIPPCLTCFYYEGAAFTGELCHFEALGISGQSNVVHLIRHLGSSGAAPPPSAVGPCCPCCPCCLPYCPPCSATPDVLSLLSLLSPSWLRPSPIVPLAVLAVQHCTHSPGRNVVQWNQDQTGRRHGELHSCSCDVRAL